MNGPFVERQGLQRLRHTCIENRKSNVHDGGDDTRVDSKVLGHFALSDDIKKEIEQFCVVSMS